MATYDATSDMCKLCKIVYMGKMYIASLAKLSGHGTSPGCFRHTSSSTWPSSLPHKYGGQKTSFLHCEMNSHHVLSKKPTRPVFYKLLSNKNNSILVNFFYIVFD